MATLRKAGLDKRPDERASTTVPRTRASRGTTSPPPTRMGCESVPSNESPDWLVPVSIVVPRVTCSSVPAGIVTDWGVSAEELPALEEAGWPPFALLALLPFPEQPGRYRAAATIRAKVSKE